MNIINRENNINRGENINRNLHLIKEQFNLVNIMSVDIFNNISGVMNINSNLLYLHYICAIGNINIIENFLIDMLNTHEREYYLILINTPIYIREINYYLYPIFTAAFWNTEHDIIRLLYSYGMNINLRDNYGFSIEEAIINIAYFHPIEYFSQNINFQNNIIYRNNSEFADIINIISYYKENNILNIL